MSNNTSKSKKKEHFINGFKVSDSVAKNILDKQEYYANDSEYLELYQNFVYSQRNEFKALMYYFNDMLSHLKEKGEISEFTEFRARIKAPKSALDNDPKKALDDVFAMEFIGATEKEVDYILKKVAEKSIVTREKNHDKPNGYKAKHRVFNIKPEVAQKISEKFNVDKNAFPLFECQFKTIAVAIEANTGTAAHINYKGIDPKVIQKKYERDEFKLGYNIPQMWVSKGKEMIKLSSDETLKKLYPFLDLTKKKELNDNIRN